MPAHLRNFWDGPERVEWGEMEPDNALVVSGLNLYVLRRASWRYVVFAYGSSGNPTLDMSGAMGNYEYDWFDPNTAAIVAGGTFPGRSAPQAFVKPDNGQWVLQVRRLPDLVIPLSTDDATLISQINAASAGSYIVIEGPRTVSVTSTTVQPADDVIIHANEDPELTLIDPTRNCYQVEPTVTFDASGGSSNNVFHLSVGGIRTGNWLRGLGIKGAQGDGINREVGFGILRARDILIEYCKFEGNETAGITNWTGVMRYCETTDNCSLQLQGTSAVSKSIVSPRAAPGAGKHTIEHCWIHDENYNGIWADCDNPSLAWRYNRIERCPGRGMFVEVSALDDYGAGPTGSEIVGNYVAECASLGTSPNNFIGGLVIVSSQNLLVQRNVIINNNLRDIFIHDSWRSFMGRSQPSPCPAVGFPSKDIVLRGNDAPVVDGNALSEATYPNLMDDTFSGEASDVNLSAHTSPDDGTTWSKHPAYAAGVVTVVSATGRVVCTTATPLYIASTTLSSANYMVHAPLYHLSMDNSSAQVVGRVDAGSDTMYQATLDVSAGLVWLAKRVTGDHTPLGAASVSLTVGEFYAMALWMDGRDIKVLWRDPPTGGTLNPVIELTDSDITAPGFAGVGFGNATTTTTGQHLASVAVWSLDSTTPAVTIL